MRSDLHRTMDVHTLFYPRSFPNTLVMDFLYTLPDFPLEESSEMDEKEFLALLNELEFDEVPFSFDDDAELQPVLVETEEEEGKLEECARKFWRAFARMELKCRGHEKPGASSVHAELCWLQSEGPERLNAAIDFMYNTLDGLVYDCPLSDAVIKAREKSNQRVQKCRANKKRRLMMMEQIDDGCNDDVDDIQCYETLEEESS